MRTTYTNALRLLWHALPVNDFIKQRAKSSLFRRLAFILNGTETYRRWEQFSTRSSLSAFSDPRSACWKRLRSSLPCVIITTKHTLYLAHLIQKALLNIGRAANIAFDYSPKTDKGQLFFVICPQMFRQLPKDFIAFQMEQSVSPRWFTKAYFSLLNQACSIFDYSLKNIEFLLKKGMPLQGLFYMPIGAFRDYESHLSRFGYISGDPGPEIDVLFYGDPNCERRQLFLNALKHEFNLHIASEVFGSDLYAFLRRAKIVVNIHYYEHALLETTRIYEALSMGIPIVSEISQDLNHHQELDGVVLFTETGNVEQMIATVRKLLESEKLIQEQRGIIKDFVQQDGLFGHYFNRYLLAMGLLSFESYAASSKVFTNTHGDIPKICLSLPETPLRTRSFLSQGMDGFQIVEGLRHTTGWIGCGLSYKYIARNLARQGVELAVICEDDVHFPPDFNDRLNRTIDYFRQGFFDWHIFAGMIADLSPSVNIIRIHEYQGVEYIYIDSMTSMVMNIYSSAGLDLLQRWDEKNMDPETNTIDRHLESFPGLVAVVTLPFLAGHAEDQESTLWGIANAEYLQLIQQSERLLADKVAAYKKRQSTNNDLTAAGYS